ncbi:MAG: hypothetical protein IJ719_03295 [Clostridia bacterium]|nr:hypothetical protein [Clostridia bacterium]
MSKQAHAGIIALVGVYLLYLSYQLLEARMGGDMTLPTVVAVLAIGGFAIAGIAVIAYAVILYRGSKKEEEPKDRDSLK